MSDTHTNADDRPTSGDEHDGHEDHGGHGGHEDHAAMFRRLFLRSLVLAIPVLLTSRTLWGWVGVDLPDLVVVDLVGPVLGTILFVDGGRTFLTSGWREVRDRQPGMMALIAMAITVAFVASWLSEFGVLDLEFWWELAGLIVIMLLGHWQEMRAIGQARSALDSLADMVPDQAEVVDDDGGTRTVPVDELQAGDVVLVRPGAAVPVDGTIVDGEAEFDESMLTGESTPVSHGPGDDIVAGSVVAGTSVRVEVSAVGDDTALAGIQRMVAEAQSSRSRSQVLADRAAAALFWYATAAGAVTAAAWLVLGQPDQAVARTVTVLVIACPHALGLAIPLVVSLSTAMAARHGILVRDRVALEQMRRVDTVVFDKTGTLTRGAHRMTAMATVEDMAQDRALALAAAVEQDSEHPLARALVGAARARDLEPPAASGFEAAAGRGVTATVDGHRVAIGGPSLLDQLDLAEAAGLRQLTDDTDDWRDRGAAVLHLVVDGDVVAAFALEDEVRDVSAQAVQALHDAGITVVMATGDAQQVADHVASQLGIDEVHAQVLPQDKEDLVARLQDQGRVVAMVGDGVNDAPALARADVGLAIGAGTDVAAASAHVVLASDDPRNVAVVRRLSTATYGKMRQNLVWAAGYNIVAVPLAAGVLAPIGFVLPPAVGAILMSLSTIIVAANAQLLRRVALDPGDAVA